MSTPSSTLGGRHMMYSIDGLPLSTIRTVNPCRQVEKVDTGK